jgi:large subunit ribosomal protein L4e
MFAPTKTWRRWHRKISVNQRRYALTSALAASALPSLVLARGHRVEQLPEVPLVVDNKVIDNVDKTSKAIALLKAVGAWTDVEKAKESRKIRPGKGKMRNRRYVQRRGPLIVYNEKGPIAKAFRNLSGVETCAVSRLNLLQLAPGGHLGRFVIWTKDAYQRLDALYGTYKKPSAEKHDYSLPRSLLSNADLARIINSDEVQSAVRAKRPRQGVTPHRKNPLNNLGFLVKLNPQAKAVRRHVLLAKEQRAKQRQALLTAKREGTDPKKAAAAKGAKPAAKKPKKKHARASKKTVALLLS